MTNLFLLAADDASGVNSSWIILVVLAVMLVGTMLLSIIPQKKRQKKAQEMMAGIKVGTKIKTIGGFVGIIKMIDNAQGTFVLDISANGDGSVLVTIDKGAVYTVINPADATADAAVNADQASAANTAVAADDVVEDAQAAEKKAAKSKKKGKAKEVVAEEVPASDEVSASEESTNDLSIDGDNSDIKF